MEQPSIIMPPQPERYTTTDNTPLYLSNKEGLIGLVVDFFNNNNLSGPLVLTYANAGNIIVADYKGREQEGRIIFYAEHQESRRDRAIGGGVDCLVQESLYQAEGRLGTIGLHAQARVYATVELEVIPGPLTLSSRRIDNEPYWFIKPGKES